jgi:hypothetical protein
VLSWLIDDGEAHGTDLSGLPVALACRYGDDEPASPWTWALYLDAAATEQQRAALRAFTGRLGGDALRHFRTRVGGALRGRFPRWRLRARATVAAVGLRRLRPLGV